MILFHQGQEKVKDLMDVRSIVKSQHKLQILFDLLFRKQGRQLVRL